MEGLLPWIVVALAVAAMFFGLRQRPAVEVRIRDGKAVVERGALPPTLVKDIEDVCLQCGVRRGRIRAYPRRGSMSLRFSRAIPASCHQRIRNVWSFHR